MPGGVSSNGSIQNVSGSPLILKDFYSAPTVKKCSFFTTATAKTDASIQNNCTILCDYNGLDCLTGTNGTTGAQRFFRALSHRSQLRSKRWPITG